MTAGLLALALLIVYPLASIVIQAFFPHLFAPQHPSARFDPAALGRVLRNPQDFHMLADSVLLSLGAALLASVIGGAMAVALGRTDVPGRGLFSGLVWCNLLMPSFLVTEGWTMMLQKGGVLSTLFPGEPTWLQNALGTPWGVGAVLALKFYPFAYLTVSAALPWLGGEHEAAARTLGATRLQVWRRVFFPLLLPFLASGAAIVFADVLSDFGVAITVAESHHFPLLTYGIYASLYDVPTDYAGAGALSLLLGLAVAAALVAQVLILRKNRFATIHTGFRPPAPARLGRRAKTLVLGAIVAFFAVSLAAPGGAILLESVLRDTGFGVLGHTFTLANYAALGHVGGRAAGALGYSLRLATLTATGAVLLGTLLAYFGTQGSGWMGEFLEGVSLWTISVPGIILAAGYVFAWNQPWLAAVHLELYGTIWALGLCYLAGGLPYVLRFQMGALTQLDRRLVAAARVQGAGTAAVIRRVVLPLLAEGALSLWLFVLAGTSFELPASEFLYPPGHPTLAVEVNHFFNEQLYGRGTALALGAAALLIALVLVMRAGLRRLLPRRT